MNIIQPPRSSAWSALILSPKACTMYMVIMNPFGPPVHAAQVVCMVKVTLIACPLAITDSRRCPRARAQRFIGKNVYSRRRKAISIELIANTISFSFYSYSSSIYMYLLYIFIFYSPRAPERGFTDYFFTINIGESWHP